MELLGVILIFIFSPFEIYSKTNVGTISKLLGGVVFYIFVLQILRKGKISIPREGLFLLIFILLGAASFYWAFYPDVSLGRSITLVQLFILFIITYNSFKNKKSAKTIAYMIFILCGVIISLNIVRQVILLGSVSKWTRISISEEIDVNHLASFLITPFLLGLHYSITKSVKYLVPTFIILSAILFTQSRGAFVAIVFSIGLYLFKYYKREKIKFRHILIFLASIFFVSNFIPKEFFHRIYLMFTDKDILLSGSGRSVIWGLAWHYFKLYPINGIGLGNFTPLYRPPHSSFFQILSELGLLGLGTISLFLLFLFHNPQQKNRARKPNIEYIIVVALLIMSLTVDIFYRKYLWIMIGIYSAQKNEIIDHESEGKTIQAI